MAELLNGWWVTETNLTGRKGWLRRFPVQVENLGAMCDDLKSLREYSPSLAGAN